MVTTGRDRQRGETHTTDKEGRETYKDNILSILQGLHRKRQRQIGRQTYKDNIQSTAQHHHRKRQGDKEGRRTTHDEGREIYKDNILTTAQGHLRTVKLTSKHTIENSFHSHSPISPIY